MSSETVGWHHPVDPSNQWDGFNDSGIDQFAGAPFECCGKELTQNSNDSHEKDTEPVRIEINHHLVETSSIPNLKELKKTLKMCLKASKKESTKANAFFTIAMEEIEKKKIALLEVSDYNTTGMRGPCENGFAFFAYMKAKGQSRKDSEDAGGSYGHGKLAPYVVSKLRTVFVSTVYKDETGEAKQLTQGKSILMSHEKDGVRRGTGFWGVKDKCNPVEGVKRDFPNWLQCANSAKELSSKIGTKLSILGFDAVVHWQEKLAASIAQT
jgi:hypothetical protein